MIRMNLIRNNQVTTEVVNLATKAYQDQNYKIKANTSH
jgi:hypothetical protein